MRKLVSTVLITVVAFTPTWLFLIVRSILEPEGFMQNFLVFGLGVYILGGLQLMLVFLFLYFLITEVWT